MIKLEMQTANMDMKQVKNIWFRSHNFCDRDEECLCGLTAHRVKSRATFFRFCKIWKFGNINVKIKMKIRNMVNFEVYHVLWKQIVS